MKNLRNHSDKIFTILGLSIAIGVTFCGLSFLIYSFVKSFVKSDESRHESNLYVESDESHHESNIFDDWNMKELFTTDECITYSITDPDTGVEYFYVVSLNGKISFITPRLGKGE